MALAYHPSAAQRRSVWITRAEPGASATAARVDQLGFDPIVAPLLSFRGLDAEVRIGEGEALAFTSINGVERTAALTSERSAPVFAVGDATAQAARAAGFDHVASAGGDVEALAALIIAAAPHGVLHPSARQTAGDLVGALTRAGIRARKIATYETQTATHLPNAVAEALACKRLAAVLIHSPKAGEAAAASFGSRGRPSPSAIAVYGLSPACVAPFHRLGFARVLAAGAPTEAALMATLATIHGPL